MAKKFAFVSQFYNFAVQDLINKIIAEAEGEDVDLIQSTPGGNVFAAWALAGFFKDREGKLTLKAFGDCSSMGYYNALYADFVEALEVTQFSIHRADGRVETEGEINRLKNINKSLRKAMESKIDQAKFENITGFTFDQIFDETQRVEVTLTAKQAKAVGLVDKVISMTDKKITALNDKFVAFSDFFETSQGREDQPQGGGVNQEPKANTDNQKVEPKKVRKMTPEQLRVEHPETYKVVFGAGVKAEKDRTGAFLAWMETDPEACKKAIENGDEMSQTFVSTMSVKALAKTEVKDQKTESPKDTEEPKEEVKSPEELKAEAKFKNAEANVLKDLGLEA